MKRRLIVVALIAVLVAWGRGQPTADYGDAPNSYQTDFASGGPYHLVVNEEWMSWPNPAISTTTTEPDARLVNQDVDVGSNR